MICTSVSARLQVKFPDVQIIGGMGKPRQLKVPDGRVLQEPRKKPTLFASRFTQAGLVLLGGYAWER